MNLANLLVAASMQIASISNNLDSGSRFQRELYRAGTGHGPQLEGSARPGDVIALAGGTLVQDLNENGLVDGFDAVVDGQLGALAPRHTLPVPAEPVGTVIDVLG
jgi:hypothetical protein